MTLQSIVDDELGAGISLRYLLRSHRPMALAFIERKQKTSVFLDPADHKMTSYIKSIRALA